MAKIEHPKVFVSYTWTSDAYVKRVVDFANRLRGDGIDVLLDKFSMKPGNEMNDFMERSVKDLSVTNVLMLLSPLYKEKADSRTGGAGKETQIISQEVYGHADNTKFIPVIFDKGQKTIADCQPVYLRGTFSIDLSDAATYEQEYKNLVRTLFGESTYIEGPLGTKPSWVGNEPTSSNLSVPLIKEIKTAKSEDEAEDKTIDAFDSLLDPLREVDFTGIKDAKDPEDIYRLVKSLIPLRNAYIDLLMSVSYQKDICDTIADFWEKVDEYRCSLPDDGTPQIIKFFMHECIVYTIAGLYRKRHFPALRSLVARDYLSGDPRFSQSPSLGFSYFFYAGAESWIENTLTNYYQKTTGQQKLSGLANYIIENAYEPRFSKFDVINADILCSSLLGALGKEYWFALTYVYGERGKNQMLAQIASRLRSKETAKDLYPLFGVESSEQMRKAIESISSLGDKSRYGFRFGYVESFTTIPLLSEYIKPEEVESHQ